MRMIGIGLMGFLLAGVALLLSTMNVLDQGRAFIRHLADEPQLVFEHRLATRAEGTDAAMILRTNPDHPVILSGFPAYQSVAFTFPVDARPTSGYLQIDATSQVLAGVEGVLRISIHNARRGEVLLRSGQAGRSLQIPLSPTDFAGDQLVVSFSLQGTGPQHQCTQDGGISAVVEIETTSAIFLALDAPMTSPRDRVHGWGNVARVAWPHWLKPDEQARRLVLATQAKRRGLGTAFVAGPDGALDTGALRTALGAFAEPTPERFDGALAQSGANAGLRRFHRQASWRTRYDLASGEAMPERLDLDLQFGRLMGNQHWALTVTLNNRLVFQGHITGAQAEYEAVIALPLNLQTRTNTLEIVAATTAPTTGICDQGPELVAEMLPSSQLVLGDAGLADPLAQVHAALGQVGPINVAVPGALSALAAGQALEMLDQVIPQGAPFKPAGQKAHVLVIAPGDPVPEISADAPIWAVTHDTATGGVRVRDHSIDTPLSATGLTLLVMPNATVLRGAEG